MTQTIAVDKLKLLKAIKDIDIAMTTIDGARDTIKNIKNEICEELDLKTKVVSKLARTFHKGNFEEEQELSAEFEKLFETITSSNKV